MQDLMRTTCKTARRTGIILAIFFAGAAASHAQGGPGPAPSPAPAVIFLAPQQDQVLRQETVELSWKLGSVPADAVAVLNIHHNGKRVKTYRARDIEGTVTLPLALTKGHQRVDVHVELFNGKTISQFLSFQRKAPIPAQMIWIEGGAFTMGCSAGDDACFKDEKPAHEVRLDGFFLDRHEVTNGKYEQCVAEGTCRPAKFAGDSRWNGADRPVIGVSWGDAQTYCRFREGRLPTEAEWEFAARAGTAGAAYGGIDDIAWHEKNAGRSTHPVGTKEPNHLGLFDMLGNVREWCADWYDEDYYRSGQKTNPQGWQTGKYRVLRGGAWDAAADDLRVSLRMWWKAKNRSTGVGFRCARDKIED